MASIEPALPEDAAQIERISTAAFAEYGEYGRIVVRFFSSQGVTTYVARVGKEVAGFIMLGFLPWAGGAEEGEPWIADLLAIAVSPERRRQGIGGALMQKMFALIKEMAEWREVREIQLTCAESNRAGLEFFSRWGFAVVDSSHGAYSRGQPALRLARKIERP